MYIYIHVYVYLFTYSFFFSGKSCLLAFQRGFNEEWSMIFVNQSADILISILQKNFIKSYLQCKGKLSCRRIVLG